jgi:hypothetical protein
MVRRASASVGAHRVRREKPKQDGSSRCPSSGSPGPPGPHPRGEQDRAQPPRDLAGGEHDGDRKCDAGEDSEGLREERAQRWDGVREAMRSSVRTD